MIQLSRVAHGVLVTETETGDTRFFHADMEWPSLASVFGWVAPDREDGTKCQWCSSEETQDIMDALDYLLSAEGRIAEDPGYFGQEAI